MSFDFEWIITHLADISILVLPGYLCQKAYRFRVSSNTPDIRILSIESVIISYIFSIIYDCLRLMLGIESELETELKCVILIAVSSILGFIFGCILSCPKIEKLVANHLHLSISNNPWHVLPNKEFGRYVKVYLKDENIYYSGSISRQFDYKGETWICIANWTRVTICNGETQEKSSCKSTDDIVPPEVVLNLSNIKRLEFSAIPASATQSNTNGRR